MKVVNQNLLEKLDLKRNKERMKGLRVSVEEIRNADFSE